MPEVQLNYMENDLCHRCTNLEIWHSKLHNTKVEICPLHHLINPSEISCSKYKEVPEEKIDGLCSTCTKLEVWYSKLFKRKVVSKDKMTSEIKEEFQIKSEHQEVCAVRCLINPNEKVCAEYEGIGTQSLNYLCSTCAELEVWYSKLLEIQMQVCGLKNRIMPIQKKCLDYEKTFSLKGE